MTEKLSIYKCHLCGNTIQVLLSGVGELVCCGEAMEELHPKYEENNELAEKHIPEIEIIDNKKTVTLKHHPMTNEHYIQFIEVYSKDKTCLALKYFNPDENAIFEVPECFSEIDTLELCNIHGLWRSKND